MCALSIQASMRDVTTSEGIVLQTKLTVGGNGAIECHRCGTASSHTRPRTGGRSASDQSGAHRSAYLENVHPQLQPLKPAGISRGINTPAPLGLAPLRYHPAVLRRAVQVAAGENMRGVYVGGERSQGGTAQLEFFTAGDAMPQVSAVPIHSHHALQGAPHTQHALRSMYTRWPPGRASCDRAVGC